MILTSDDLTVQWFWSPADLYELWHCRKYSFLCCEIFWLFMEKCEYEVSIFQRSCGVRWWCSVNSFSEIERRRKDDFLNCIDQDTLWRCFINFHCWPFHTNIRLDKCDSLKCMSASVWHLFIYFLNSYKYSCTLQLVCLITLFLLNVFSQLFNSLLFF